MSSTNTKFKADMRRFAKKAQLNMDDIVRKVALDLLRAIIKRSPVDTGRFRGNWMVQASIAPQVSDGVDKTGNKSITAGAEEIARFKVGGHLYILNHLPYSIVLERGSSDQAPLGIVRITALEYRLYLRKQASLLRAR